jgi:molybdopterin-biosynthesis enzyme MoeA-like protein
MFKLLGILVFVLGICPAYAQDTVENEAHEYAVQQLVTKLEARDLTIRELKESNLELVLKNMELDEANHYLRSVLLSSEKKASQLQKKYNHLVSVNNSLRKQLQAQLVISTAEVKSKLYQLEVSINKTLKELSK